MSDHYRAEIEAPWTWGSLAVAGVIVIGQPSISVHCLFWSSGW